MLKFHLTGAGLTVGAVILAVTACHLSRRSPCTALSSTPKEQVMVNRAEELITQLEAEIVKRDARIVELEEELALSNECLDMANENFAAVKANKPVGLVLPERSAMQSMLDIGWNRALDEVARLNPCRAVAVPAGHSAQTINTISLWIGQSRRNEHSVWAAGITYEGHVDKISVYGQDRHRTELLRNHLYQLLLAAAPSAQQKEGGGE